MLQDKIPKLFENYGFWNQHAPQKYKGIKPFLTLFTFIYFFLQLKASLSPMWNLKKDNKILLIAELKIYQFSPAYPLIKKSGEALHSLGWSIVCLVVCHAEDSSYVTLAFEGADCDVWLMSKGCLRAVYGRSLTCLRAVS